MRAQISRLVTLCTITLLAVGCGPGSDGDVDTTPVEPAAASASQLASQTSCTLDSDCAAGAFCFQGGCVTECSGDSECSGEMRCTSRGQCVAPEAVRQVDAQQDDGKTQQVTVAAEASVTEFYEGVTLQNSLPGAIRVSGEEDLSVTLELNEPLPNEGMPYRIARTDAEPGEATLERTEGGVQSVTIPIGPGAAVPTLPNSQRVTVELYTPIDVYTIRLQPAYSASGAYNGRAKLQGFGQAGLPIDFEIVTDPAEASLDEADTSWLVLPVGANRLFSPIFPTGERDNVAIELQRVDNIGYVAAVDSAFDVGADDIWPAMASDQVQRTLRFELKVAGKGLIRGRFRDTWKNHYEVSTAQGNTSGETVRTTGTIELQRVGEARSQEKLDTSPTPAADTELAPPPPAIDACDGSTLFAEDPQTIDGTDYSCAGINDTEAFLGASPAQKASCAVAAGEVALGGETTGSAIRSYLEDGSSGDGDRSFQQFLEDCAAPDNDTCLRSDQVACSRELLGRAYHDQGDRTDDISRLIESYLTVSRESYFGRQLAAFGSDFSLRQDWLESTNYPAIVTSKVQNFSEGLLDEWRDRVLDVHMSVLRDQFDPSGLAVMSRQTQDDGANDARQRLLLELTSTWRGSMDSLTLATQRWNELLRSEADRQEKTAYVTRQMFRLYLTANALRSIAQSAGVGALVARFGSGFSGLIAELQQLSLAFDERIYARDAEVVVNTSVDPEMTSDSVLSQRKKEALDELEKADSSITGVLADARAEALEEEQLRNEMNNQIDDLRADLVELCGLPDSCSVDDWADEVAGCTVDVAFARCGFAIDPQSGEITGYVAGAQNTSEAGSDLLAYSQAAQNIRQQKSARNAHVQNISYEYEDVNAFSKEIEEWNDRRQQELTALEENIAQRQDIRNDRVNTILDKIEQRARGRQGVIASMRSTFGNWQSIRSANVDASISSLVQAANKRSVAAKMELGAQGAEATADVAAESIPGEAKGSAVALALSKAGIKAAGHGIALGLQDQARQRRSSAANLDLEREKQERLNELELQRLEEESDVSTAVAEADIADLGDEIRKKQQLSNREIAELKETAELMRAYRQAELTYERDLAEFRSKRTDLFQLITKLGSYDLAVAKARLKFAGKRQAYAQTVQEAQLKQSKLETLIRQRKNVNQLVGSPNVIFAQANELQRAERRLADAKDKLMEWLVALEYFAVRPFMDQRIQILLARNTYQLEKIAGEMENLQKNCGAPDSEVTTTLSMRDDFLGLTRPVEDSVTGEVLEPADRFRRVLNRGHVPIDRRVRYSNDDTVGSLLGRNPGVMAASFQIKLSEFANLTSACNAKVRGIRIQLVGEIGEGRPNAALLYDGMSELASCQPGIEKYISQFGAASTSFGAVTQLRTEGQSMTPIAGVNEFPGRTDQTNKSFSGLPLSTSYTLLIDKTAGENNSIDWAKLEDIKIELTYSYQDVFPEGRCGAVQ